MEPAGPSRGNGADSRHGVSLYGPAFWHAYASNWLVMVAVAILYRFADFITYLGGTELHLGWIVGVGMVGSMATRLVVGAWIDRYGPRLVWIGSLALFALSCLAHLAVASYRGPSIYLLRILYCSACAGVFGASMTFVSGRAPVRRVAEMLGMLGTSGFAGMIAGTLVADWLCHGHVVDRSQVDRMFLVAAGLALASIAFAWKSTSGLPRRDSGRRHPPLFWILRRYHPGVLLMVCVAMGVGLGLPSTFFRTFAADLHVGRISVFFAVYAPVAILTRIVTRRMPERLGLPPMILAGQGLLVLSLVVLVFVSSEWQFVLPAAGYGMAHAILYPSVVAAGSGVFPTRYRGLGMTLMLASYDLGLLVGSPTAGAIVHYGSRMGLPGYPAMFLTMAAMLGLVGLVYQAFRSREKIRPHDRLTVRSEQPPRRSGVKRRKKAAVK